MIEVLQRLALEFQRVHHADLARIVLVARCTRDLHLLHGDYLSGRGVQRHVDPSEVALADQLTANPLENGCKPKD